MIGAPNQPADKSPPLIPLESGRLAGDLPFRLPWAPGAPATAAVPGCTLQRRSSSLDLVADLPLTCR